jgi:hypothetical protein
MESVQRLEAVDAIERLQARRVRCLDTKDWRGYAECHDVDFSFDADGVTVRGIEKVVERLRNHLENATSVHHVHSPEIELTSDTSATGIWVLEDELTWRTPRQTRWFHGYGHYFDTYRKVDGVWLFLSREVKRLRIEEGKVEVFETG